MIKRIVFDIDGTLIKYFDFKFAVETLFQDFKVSYTEDNINEFVLSMEDYYKNYSNYNLKDFHKYINYICSIEITKSMVESYLEHYERILPEKDYLVIEVLEYLKCQNYQLVALTNFFTDVQTKRLKAMGLYDYLDFIIGGEIGVKPNPIMYQEAAKNINHENVLFIGDNYEQDYLVPKSLGYKAFHLNPEYISTGDKINSLSDLKYKL